MIETICVFCASAPGNRAQYQEAAQLLGQEIAHRGLKLIYGGGNAGLMGVVANAALQHGGHVIGTIPHGLVVREAMHNGLTEHIVVNSMHERKSIMAERADAFVALPGGYGTYEELFEIITWGQLGIHYKPIIVFNIEGYFDPFIQIVDRGIEDGFIRPIGQDLYRVAHTVEEVFQQIEGFTPNQSRPKWLTKDQI